MAPLPPKPAHIKLLLIEDSTPYQMAVATHLLLSERVAELCVARSGGEALRLPQRLEPDVVLLDIHLPDQSGLELIQPLLERWPRAKIIALSIDDYGPMRRAMLLAGACDFVSKMDAAETLMPALERCVHGG